MHIFMGLLGLVLMLGWVAFYIYSRVIKRQPSTILSKFLGWTGLLIFIIGFIITPTSDDDETKKDSSVKSENVSSTNKNSSSESSNLESKKSSTSKTEKKDNDLDTINTKMAKSLDEDKSFAQGGNDSYNYALEINQWQLRKSGYIYIVIDGTKFYNETNLGTRQEFINKISNSANGAYSMASNNYDDSNKNIKVYVDGVDEPVAQSSISDHEPKLTKTGQR